MANSAYNPYTIAQEQFDKAADILNLDKASRDLLRTPMKEFHFSIPVRMDDGIRRIFKGFRIMHNDARGPAKGGIRFHPHETVDTMRALSMLMSWKTAVADLPLGGGKGGVICDPHDLSLNEQEQICRGWVRQNFKNIGANIDVPAPELMTNAQHMLWMLDEYETITGERQPGFITGKPVGMGGSLGRKEATGYGVMLCVREALKELNIKPSNTTASFQGFGNVAQNAIELYTKMGGKILCVSSWNQQDMEEISFCKEDGIDLLELKKIADPFGGIDKIKAKDLGYQVIAGNEWIKKNVDILVPAAVENQINEDNIELISEKVKIIAEGANSPTNPKVEPRIHTKDIKLIPDLLANSGGAICSYFEQVQSNMNYYWDKNEVFGKLDQKITAAYISISEFAKKNKMNMREAAYIIAVDRVAVACRERGWV
ncbi:MAG: Glu/Leu/Phe/Val dehydrogenase [Candidatus Delongbacteria bacterium]|nr:Glu/Leu/Phe/Val dehydrogenase [Candidatus Delongbacteria bacterium]MCG2760553.1 Glu/Leu/Phe/Val dehydrogenase [Candidatus Delongbacteria bacterium]